MRFLLMRRNSGNAYCLNTHPPPDLIWRQIGTTTTEAPITFYAWTVLQLFTRPWTSPRCRYQTYIRALRDSPRAAIYPLNGKRLAWHTMWTGKRCVNPPFSNTTPDNPLGAKDHHSIKHGGHDPSLARRKGEGQALVSNYKCLCSIRMTTAFQEFWKVG